MRNGLVFLASLALFSPALAQERAAPRPNIVVIMADDMGYSDLGCYGGEIRTPNLDRLAASGLRFTQFYNTARCCPTRAALLTGLYSHQAGVGHMTSDRGYDGYRGDLNRRCVTIAEALRPAGYSTYMSGKWHVTKHVNPQGPKDNWPLQRGFERFYGTVRGGGSYFDPGTLTRGNEAIAPDAADYYYTDAISANASRFIAEHCGREKDRPFFLYVAYTAPHWPMHARESDIARYSGHYTAGWDALRQQRVERMRAMGLLREGWELTPRDEGVPPWEEAELKPWMERRMEVYAAMVTSMDRGIGEIVGALESAGVLEETLVLFLADNGGCAEETGSRGAVTPDPSKPVELRPMAPGELQSDGYPKWTRDGRPVRRGRGVMPGPADTFVAYGKPWANLSNTPFRRYKHWVHEGGIATPLVAHWPAGFARRGELEHQPGHVIDLMATCIDVAGARYPEAFAGERIQPMEGRSLVPALSGEVIEREALYWEHEGNRAVRRGRWKLVARGKRGPWELYDMERDRSELHDLAAPHPERVVELEALWRAWAERAQVLPLDPKPPEVFSKARTFRLEAGAELPRAAAPDVRGKALRVTARIAAAGGDGVIVAQGGSTHGWVLFMRAGHLAFATRHGGKLTLVVAGDPLPRRRCEVGARLARNGAVRLYLDGKPAGQGKAPGCLQDMPIDGLQVGRDLAGAVGPYEVSHAFVGELEWVAIQLEE